MTLTRPITAHNRPEKGRMYCQCQLWNRRIATPATMMQWAFIPAEFAVVGRTVNIKEEGVWRDGWEVVYAGDPKDESYIDGLYSQWKRHAEVSDI